MQPYKPKMFDPGRLNHTVNFYLQTTVPNTSGGTTVSTVLSLSTRGAKLDIREGDQLAIQAGASLLEESCYYVIRNRKEWYPEKDMVVEDGSARYTLRAIIPLNEPINYLKLLCIKSI